MPLLAAENLLIEYGVICELNKYGKQYTYFADLTRDFAGSKALDCLGKLG